MHDLRSVIPLSHAFRPTVIGPWILATHCILLMPSLALTQRPATPAFEMPAQVPVWGAFVDYGSGVGIAATGDLRTFRARAQLGAGNRAKFTLGGALIDADRGDGWGLDAGAAWLVRQPFPGRGVAVNLPGMLSFSRIDAGEEQIDVLDASIGLGLSIWGPTPFLGIEPWVSPRIQLRHTSADATLEEHTGTRVGPGVSVGLALITATRFGFGINVAGDLLAIEEPLTEDWETNTSLGIGIHILQ